jgi:predicted negative regulator of RcsB-dependent stress response
MAYLNTGKYAEAIDYLGKFKSDVILSGLATGAIEMLMQKNKSEEALKNYVKAAETNKNDFTTFR